MPVLRGATTRPIAPVVAMATNGEYVNEVTVSCVFCGGRHTFDWDNEPDGIRMPTCGTRASLQIRLTGRARMMHMRTAKPAAALRPLASPQRCGTAVVRVFGVIWAGGRAGRK